MFTSILILRRIKIELDRLKEESKDVCCEVVHIKLGSVIMLIVCSSNFVLYSLTHTIYSIVLSQLRVSEELRPAGGYYDILGRLL
jgi:hypothetical protein